MQACKPDSVSAKADLCHLSGFIVTNEIYLPTPRKWASNPFPTNRDPVYMALHRIEFT